MNMEEAKRNSPLRSALGELIMSRVPEAWRWKYHQCPDGHEIIWKPNMTNGTHCPRCGAKLKSHRYYMRTWLVAGYFCGIFVHATVLFIGILRIVTTAT